ncbi:hypothetical protein Tco_1384663 [Tanacetum coccineum]
MVDYVNENYGTSWLFNNEVSDEILDDLLKRVYENQQRVKDDKATGTEIIDDVDKENVNVEVIPWNVKGVFGWLFKHKLTDDWASCCYNLKVPSLRHPFHMKFTNYILRAELIILDSDTCNSDDSWEPTKSVNKINSKSVLKGKHGTSYVSFKGRKGSPSKKGSCSKSIKTKPWKVLKFYDDSSSDDHGSVFRGKPGKSSVYSKGKKRSVSNKGTCSKKGSCSKSENTKALNVIKFYNDSSSDEHGSVFRGKPGSTSKGVRAPKHSRAKQSKGKRKMV